MPQNPFILTGTVYQSTGIIEKTSTIDTGLGGRTINFGAGDITQTGVTITITNETTDETLTVVSGANGAYVIDLANFASGFTNGDELSLLCEYTTKAETEDLPLNLPDQNNQEWLNTPKARRRVLSDVDGYEIGSLNPLPVMEVVSANIKTTGVSVTTSATKLPTTALVNRKSIIVYNNESGATVFVGGSGVTTSNGIPVPNTSSIEIDITEDIPLYGIVSSSTADVRIMEIS